MKISISLLVSIFFVSCAQGPFYPQGPSDFSKSAMFIQTNRTEMSLTRMTSYHLGTINGLPLGKAATFPNGEKGYPVTAGNYTLGVTALHGSPPHQQGRLNADGVIRMKVNSGMVYEVTGSVSSAHRVDFWIQDQNSKKRVSEIVTVTPKNITITAPVLTFP